MPRPRLQVTPDHNLALDLVRTTEAAALAAARWVGRGDKNAADKAAVDAMRLLFNSMPFDGIVVIGEGEKDEAPMLFNGEHLGTGDEPRTDVAVDPIDGTRLVARGEANAVAVVAVAERGSMFNPGPCFYMEKLIAGHDGGHVLDVTAPIEDNVRNLAKARNMHVGDMTVMILDRERHHEFIERVRGMGARVHLITDGDVAGAITAARRGTGVDLLYGIGGTPEGVIAAAALKCLGGVIQGRLHPRNAAERQAAIDAGYDLDRVLHTDDLVKGDNVFFAATGITDGSLLRGVRYSAEGATTESIVMRSRSGTIRTIAAQHRWEAPSEATAGRWSGDRPAHLVPPILRLDEDQDETPNT
ncbi:class II fructose-bisphosphatase [Paludisphaera borealis]|uniref:class II fructose-bisphosphatase n=1 Tax=Paludisphaera borealis TaxID=1387353 RepID=UPI002852934C|nr:class II fructose-bisphosphatase [Paludisphaera borealis]